MNQDWRDMPLFKGVDLNDSFVLGWHVGPDSLRIDLETSLWPEHPLYEPPREGEWTCYRSAHLLFPDLVHLTGLKDMSTVRPSSDATGAHDYGNIDTLSLQSDGCYAITGEFGDLRVVSGPLLLQFR